MARYTVKKKGKKKKEQARKLNTKILVILNQLVGLLSMHRKWLNQTITSQIPKN